MLVFVLPDFQLQLLVFAVLRLFEHQLCVRPLFFIWKVKVYRGENHSLLPLYHVYLNCFAVTWSFLQNLERGMYINSFLKRKPALGLSSPDVFETSSPVSALSGFEPSSTTG